MNNLIPQSITAKRASDYNTRWQRQAESVAIKAVKGGFLTKKEQQILAEYRIWQAKQAGVISQDWEPRQETT